MQEIQKWGKSVFSDVLRFPKFIVLLKKKKENYLQ